jgi:hypothetical protein
VRTLKAETVDDQGLTEDIRQADEHIRLARAKVRLKLTLAGVCVEAEPPIGMTRGVEAVITWSALAQANEPMIAPLVHEMLKFLQHCRANVPLNSITLDPARLARLN